MADPKSNTATATPPAANGEAAVAKKPRKPAKPRIPDGHTQVRFTMPTDEYEHLTGLAQAEDRQTGDDMARVIARQHVRKSRGSSASTTAPASA